MQAVEVIKGVLSVYDLGCKWMFTCGQQAYADYMQVSLTGLLRPDPSHWCWPGREYLHHMQAAGANQRLVCARVFGVQA